MHQAEAPGRSTRQKHPAEAQKFNGPSMAIRKQILTAEATTRLHKTTHYEKIDFSTYNAPYGTFIWSTGTEPDSEPGAET